MLARSKCLSENVNANGGHPQPLITLTINDTPIEVADGTTVGAAIACAGLTVFRSSVSGEPRGPLCGMGICFECRVRIDGIEHQRSCVVLAADGMEVVTGG